MHTLRTLLSMALGFPLLVGCGGNEGLEGKSVSGFTMGTDDWLITGDANSSSVKPDFNGTGGNPDGLISAKDEATGGVWFFVAPAKYLGDNKQVAGMNLRFDLKVDATPTRPFDDVDVKLEGGGVTLVYDTPNNPVGGTWTSYVVPLKASGWKVKSLTGAAATDADLNTVLANTTALWIRGEFNTGPDTGYLDNVRWGASN